MSSHQWLEQLLAPKYFLWMWHGLLTTLLVTAITALVATALGLVLAAARSNEQTALARLAKTYTTLFRNTPLLVQLLFWYFGVPSLFPEGAMEWLNADHHLALAGVFTLSWPSYELLSALCGLTLYSSAYISEEIRSGLRGVAHSQTLAGAALGLTRIEVLRYIILPQATRIALPPLLGQYMNILKNTSLTMTIGVAELSYTARQVEAETFRTFQAFGLATIMYIFAIALIEALSQWQLGRLNKRTGRY